MSLPVPGGIYDADQYAPPGQRRYPENEIGRATAAKLGDYSIDQHETINRILPIRLCTFPEYYLAEGLEEYISKDFGEDDNAYEARKTRALTSFYPYYSHYVEITVGTALRKGVITPQEVPGGWDNVFEDANLSGESISSFAKNCFIEAINGGVGGIMSEYTGLSNSSTQEERDAARPYFTIYKVDDVLDCRFEVSQTTINGKTFNEVKVVYLRLKTEKRQASAENEHYEEVIPRITVLDIPGKGQNVRVRFYEKNGGDSIGDYTEKTDEEKRLSIDYIPFTPVYGGKKEGHFRARPLLFDIARLNLHHWSKRADLDEIIHLHASPIPTGVGVKPEETVFTKGRSFFSENENAKFDMLRGGLDGAEVALRDLENIVSNMDRVAAIAMTPSKTQAESGFSKLLDRSQSDSQLAVLVGSLEDSLNKAIKYASGYDPKKFPPVTIKISKNFIPAKLHSQQVLAIIQLFREAQVIDIQTLLDMLDAGEIFEGIHDFDVKKMLTRMGLSGAERYSDIVVPTEKSADQPAKPQSLSSETAGGAPVAGEPPELTLEFGE